VVHNIVSVKLLYGVHTTCSCSRAVEHGYNVGVCVIFTCSWCVANFGLTHAELLLKGATQAAPDIPGMGIHARPAAMSKTGFMIDLRDQHVRAVSLAMTKASLQAECRRRGIRANNGETKDVIHARLLTSDTNDLDQAKQIGSTALSTTNTSVTLPTNQSENFCLSSRNVIGTATSRYSPQTRPQTAAVRIGRAPRVISSIRCCRAW
jgi:hypothetical protein